jgi:hypothetical protein
MGWTSTKSRLKQSVYIHIRAPSASPSPWASPAPWADSISRAYHPKHDMSPFRRCSPHSIPWDAAPWGTGVSVRVSFIVFESCSGSKEGGDSDVLVLCRSPSRKSWLGNETVNEPACKRILKRTRANLLTYRLYVLAQSLGFVP